MIQFKWIADRINRMKKDVKVLDVGAGIKELKKSLDSRIVYHSLDIEGEHTYNHNLDSELPIIDESYNVIVLMDILEHCTEPDKVMETLKRISTKDAVFFIALPNEYSWLFRIYHLFGHVTKMDVPFQIVTQHLHIHRPRVKDIISFCRKHLMVIETANLWYADAFPRAFNWIVNGMAKVVPNLFAKEVLVMGVKK